MAVVSAASAHAGQLLTVLMMAVALGMDAFSLGIGIGLKGIRLLHILRISIVTALFHIIMPLVGLFMGQYASALLGDVAMLAGGGLLLLLGAHMVYSAFHNNPMVTLDYRSTWSLLLFALSVSIDSLSVGVSLGLFSTDIILTVLLFGAFGGLMSILGLWLGRNAGRWAGKYGEALGGIILVAFGIRFLL
ncbi:manganese efflux pump MntP [Paenibacillus koleovorans]|uniref:manganese efflux pump MntP n=1 Tax=Paenibacillus koleovorans TaxID=121608 RepID=UPI000FD953D2|nr:manganese efflux pump MntP family protein [Paenibacillus koleovorans]